ncbi:hypothetical protein J8273_0364 [Carpediemonas membranifera]|uniref:Uncharacterized protein n=1 Tax=Carpediemonas membranifera TaxID=201153 RepID=A0A8J6AZF3_9EUKA|nr:hypothetical protein J8273_0364 [Carpediemonas membranifera]|eukprot:KAG9395145.1 hypothetical protein J8273_0364 [Carpediemonas membranifera]
MNVGNFVLLAILACVLADQSSDTSATGSHIMQFVEFSVVDNIIDPLKPIVDHEIRTIFSKQEVGHIFGYFLTDINGDFLPVNSQLRYSYNSSGIILLWDLMANSAAVWQANDYFFETFHREYMQKPSGVLAPPEITINDLRARLGQDSAGYYSSYLCRMPMVNVTSDQLPETLHAFDTFKAMANQTMTTLLEIEAHWKASRILYRYVESIAADLQTLLAQYPVALTTWRSDPQQFQFSANRTAHPMVVCDDSWPVITDIAGHLADPPTSASTEHDVQEWISQMWALIQMLRRSLAQDPLTFPTPSASLVTAVNVSKTHVDTIFGDRSEHVGQTAIVSTALTVNPATLPKIFKSAESLTDISVSSELLVLFSGTAIPGWLNSASPAPFLLDGHEFHNPSFESYELQPGPGFTALTDAGPLDIPPTEYISVHLKDYSMWLDSIARMEQAGYKQEEMYADVSASINTGLLTLTANASFTVRNNSDPLVLRAPEVLIVLSDSTRPGFMSWVIPTAWAATVLGTVVFVVGVGHTAARAGWGGYKRFIRKERAPVA